MKKIVCILGVLTLLFIGSLNVFADPWAIPDTDQNVTVCVHNPIVISVTTQDSDS
ncbi:MAG: hypothetical protein KAX49_09985 [Halanaerobiales bacterium]|nr:hypothetical protein [Halanaerobiales bacterium]